MNHQFLRFQLLCIFLVASSAHGKELPTSITSQYYYCYEMRQFSVTGQMPGFESSFLIDHLCMDWQGLTYHFLSSTQGGTESIISAPKAGMTVIHLDSITINIELEWCPRANVTFYCQFAEPTHVLHIYNDIYKFVPLKRAKFSIGRIQKLLLDGTGSRIMYDSVLTHQAGLYTEFYNDMQMVLTFKEESSNGDVGDPVLIFLANSCNVSNVLVHKNVIVRFNGNAALFMVFTFRDESEATDFCNTVRAHVDENKVAPIPSVIQEVLVTKRV